MSYANRVGHAYGGGGYAGQVERGYGASVLILPPFGPPHTLAANVDYRLLSASIGYRMITVTGSTGLTDITIGDSYPLILSGTLSVPGTFTAARLVVKRNKSDEDDDALIDSSVTATLSANGQIQTNGAAGPYAVLFTLSDDQTATLTPITGQVYFQGYWEIRLTTAAGAEYTPVREAQVIAKPRLILAV